MTKTIDIDSKIPHRVSMVICLKCYKRWLAVRPMITKLVDIECPECGAGFVIETGEIIEN